MTNMENMYKKDGKYIRKMMNSNKGDKLVRSQTCVGNAGKMIKSKKDVKQVECDKLVHKTWKTCTPGR